MGGVAAIAPGLKMPSGLGPGGAAGTPTAPPNTTAPLGTGLPALLGAAGTSTDRSNASTELSAKPRALVACSSRTAHPPSASRVAATRQQQAHLLRFPGCHPRPQGPPPPARCAAPRRASDGAAAAAPPPPPHWPPPPPQKTPPPRPAAACCAGCPRQGGHAAGAACRSGAGAEPWGRGRAMRTPHPLPVPSRLSLSLAPSPPSIPSSFLPRACTVPSHHPWPLQPCRIPQAHFRPGALQFTPSDPHPPNHTLRSTHCALPIRTLLVPRSLAAS